MSFFNYTPDPSRSGWSVSSEFWIYWVCAVPLTCLTLAVWHWRQGMGRRLIRMSAAQSAKAGADSKLENFRWNKHSTYALHARPPHQCSSVAFGNILISPKPFVSSSGETCVDSREAIPPNT